MYEIINQRVILYLCLGQFLLEKYRHSGACIFGRLSKFENSASQYLYKVILYNLTLTTIYMYLAL